MSNNGLNSNEALDESTATNSSVTLSGIRRVKEAPTDLDITDYSRNPGNSDPPCISAAPAALDRYLAAEPAMSLVPLAPFARGYGATSQRVKRPGRLPPAGARDYGEPRTAAARNRSSGFEVLLPFVDEDLPALDALLFQDALFEPGVVLHFLSHFVFIFSVEE